MKKTFARIMSILCVLSILFVTGCTPQPVEDGSSVAQTSSDSVSSVTTSVPFEDTSSAITSEISSDIASADTSKPNSSKVPSVSSNAGITSSKVSEVTSSQVSNSNGVTPPKPVVKPDPNKYVQKQFYISTWRAVNYSGSEEIYRKLITLTKEVGINLIENAILGRDDYLLSAKICEEVGIDFMANNITLDRGFTGQGDVYPENLTMDDVKFVVDELKNYKHLIGYYLWDEVPNFTADGKTNLFTVLRNHKELFQKADPTKLAFSIVNASYGGDKWFFPAGTKPEGSDYYKKVTNYVKQVDPPVLGFDYYAFFTAGTSLVESGLWRDLGLHRKLSVDTGKPLWWVFQGYDQADGTVGHMTREKLAVQMFAGLAYGCKTLTYYTSYGALVNPDGTKTTLFEDAKTLNAEVQNLGNLLFDKKSSEIYHFGLSEKLEEGCFLDDISKSSVIKKAPDKTIVSVFTDNTNAKYVMVVNKDHTKPLKGNLQFKKNVTIEEYDKVNNKLRPIYDNVGAVYMNIKPGDCVVYKIK